MLEWNRQTRSMSLPTSQAMLGKGLVMNIGPKEERRRPNGSPETPEKMSTVQTTMETTMAIMIDLTTIVIITVTAGLFGKNIETPEIGAGHP